MHETGMTNLSSRDKIKEEQISKFLFPIFYYEGNKH